MGVRAVRKREERFGVGARDGKGLSQNRRDTPAADHRAGRADGPRHYSSPPASPLAEWLVSTHVVPRRLSEVACLRDMI